MYKIFLTAFLLGLLVYSDALAVNYVPVTSNPWYTSGYSDLPWWANFWVSFAGEDMTEYEIFWKKNWEYIKLTSSLCNWYFLQNTSAIQCTTENSIAWSGPNNMTWYNNSDFYYIDSTPPPPTTIWPNWLNCSTKKAPDIENANWHYPWRYTNFYDQSSTGALRLVFRESNLNNNNVDIIEYSLINDGGSEIPENSINWTNTGSNAFLIGNWELRISGVEERNFRAFNLVQIGWIALPTWTTLPIRYESLNWNLHDGISILSWSTLTIWFNDLVKKVWISNIGRFNWIRLWVAPEKTVKFCGVSNAWCGYKFIWTGLQCTPLRVFTTLSQGWCVISGSGSLYGSWSCVPAVNASGSIIPFVVTDNNTIQYDQNGNVIWSIINPLPDNTYFNNVFNCWFSEDESWYGTIWKSLICPITVTKNILFNAWDNVNEAFNWLQPLQNSINNLDTVTGNIINTGSQLTWFTENFAEKLDVIGNNNTWFDKIFNFVWYGMISTVIIFIMGIIIFLIRKNK